MSASTSKIHFALYSTIESTHKIHPCSWFLSRSRCEYSSWLSYATPSAYSERNVSSQDGVWGWRVDVEKLKSELEVEKMPPAAYFPPEDIKVTHGATHPGSTHSSHIYLPLTFYGASSSSCTKTLSKPLWCWYNDVKSEKWIWIPLIRSVNFIKLNIIPK